MVTLVIQMPKTKAEKAAEYIFVKLPKSLLDEVDKELGKHGYRSRSEFLKDAVRSLLRQYGAYQPEEEIEPKLSTRE